MKKAFLLDLKSSWIIYVTLFLVLLFPFFFGIAEKIGSKVYGVDDLRLSFEKQTKVFSEQIDKLQQQSAQIMEQQFIFLSYLKNAVLPIPCDYRDSIVRASKRWHVPISVLYVVIEVETGGTWSSRIQNKNSNGSTDHYLTQINSYYEKEFVNEYWDRGQRFDGDNPDHAIYLTAGILSGLHDRLGLWTKAIMSYNAGVNEKISKGDVVTSAYLEKAQKSLGEYADLILKGNSN